MLALLIIAIVWLVGLTLFVGLRLRATKPKPKPTTKPQTKPSPARRQRSPRPAVQRARASYARSATGERWSAPPALDRPASR